MSKLRIKADNQHDGSVLNNTALKNIFIYLGKNIMLIMFFLFFMSSANAQDYGFRKVVAKQGDGIFKILRENNFDPSDYFHDFIEINRNKIIDNNQLIVGETYYLPLTNEEKQNAHRIDSLAKSLLTNDISDNKDDDIDNQTSEDEVDTNEIEIEDSSDDSTLNKLEIIPKEDSVFTKEASTVKQTTVKSEFAIQHGLLYADTIYDNSLEGSLIYIISGHGGPDPGAIAIVDGIRISEDEYAYDICLRIAKKIEEHGGKTIMVIHDTTHCIRDDRILPLDKTELCYPNLEIPLNHIQRLRQRVDAVNNLYAENRHIKYHRVIEIHLDSRSTGTLVDVFFYHYPQSNTGKAFAENLRNLFDEKYAEHQPNRGYSGTVSGRNLYVIRRTHPPAVLVELGNIQNIRDQKRFLNPYNRQALANWITEGIIKDYKN
jgi:N-acetylmuramoyl-L-alanine amidase